MLSFVVTNQVGKWQTNDTVSNKENWEVRFQYILDPINLRSSIKASVLTVSIFFPSESWKVRPQVLSEAGIIATGKREGGKNKSQAMNCHLRSGLSMAILSSSDTDEVTLLLGEAVMCDRHITNRERAGWLWYFSVRNFREI